MTCFSQLDDQRGLKNADLLSKIAIFVKIATLQGATFGIQFESPALWRFSPFSPLGAFLDIRGGYIKLCKVNKVNEFY